MQAANRLQKALKSGKTTFGGWQTLPGSNLSRTLARTPGLDWICIDCEHGNISDDSMHESVAAIAACGISPIVRVADAQHWMVKRALDAGAHGIVVPLLNTADDARKIAKFSKFPPQGNRGLGSPFSMEKFVTGADVAEVSMGQYYSEANDSLVVIAQIETADALANVREIAAVPGVDVLFVGPNDLGNSIGHPMVTQGGKHDPELDQAIATIREAAKSAGKFSGIFSGSGAQARQFADEGFDMVCAATDQPSLKRAFAQALSEAKGSYLHAGVQGIKEGINKITKS